MFNNFFKSVLEAFFPSKCLLCKKEGAYLCENHNKFEKASHCEDYNLEYIDNVYTAVKYHTPQAEKTIAYLKFKGFRELKGIIAQEILENIDSQVLTSGILVPIPLHWTRQISRGFNQSNLIIEALQEKNTQIKSLKCLKRSKRTKQQAKLNPKERVNNTRNIFEVPKNTELPVHIILIDDVVTTGKTLEAAAKVLKDSGVKTVEAVIFAKSGK